MLISHVYVYPIQTPGAAGDAYAAHPGSKVANVPSNTSLLVGLSFFCISLSTLERLTC